MSAVWRSMGPSRRRYVREKATAMVVLAFDVGKTKCRVAVFDGERRLTEGEQPGMIGLADPAGIDAALDAMADVSSEVSAGRVDAVCAGMAGFGQAREQAPKLAAGLASRFATGNVVLASDITISHAGALGGYPGVVIAAGTGSVALAIGADGAWATSDGWGYLLGDEGSGYAIGRAGLASALREFDGRRGSAVLRSRAEQRFGPLARLPALIHGDPNPARLIASFAHGVADAARKGDESALEVWQAAGRALASTTAAAGKRIFADLPFDVAATGGLFEAGALLLDPFKAELERRAPASNLRERKGDALEGARLIAADSGLPHAALTLRPLQDQAAE